MSDRKDTVRLNTAAKALSDELRKQHPHYLLRIKRKLEKQPTETGGRYVTVATWHGHPNLELWLDKFLGDSVRHFWFGFFSEEESKISELISAAPEPLQPKMKLSNKDIETKQNVQLKQRPSDKDITHSISEIYLEDKEFLFGMRDTGSHGSSDPLQLDALRAANFIGGIVNAATDRETGDIFLNMKGIEGRRKVAWHLRRERDPKLARCCKERDKFRCQVCDFHFEEFYGDIGKEFAEAHHMVPLNRLRGSTSVKLRDLKTVCSNCHQMLHKMSGATLSTLRKKIVGHRHSAASGGA